MGITAALTTIGDDNLRRIVEHPPLVMRIIAPDDVEAYQEAVAWASRPRGFWARWFGSRGKVETSELVIPDVEFEPGDDRSLFLDKAWDGLHFLLSRSASNGPEPLCFLLQGGQIGELEVYPDQTIRLLSSDEIGRFDDALSNVSTETFKSKFDPHAMMKAGVYPEVWECDPAEDDTLAWLVGYFERLKPFVHESRQMNRGIIISIG